MIGKDVLKRQLSAANEGIEHKMVLLPNAFAESLGDELLPGIGCRFNVASVAVEPGARWHVDLREHCFFLGILQQCFHGDLGIKQFGHDIFWNGFSASLWVDPVSLRPVIKDVLSQLVDPHFGGSSVAVVEQ